jgi:hypothetical protein
MPKIELECGKFTCYKEKGKPCIMVGTEFFGTKFVCRLFNRELFDNKGQLSGDGWLMRLPECLKATRE